MRQSSITADLNFEKRWQEGIKDWNGNIPKRMTDDHSEEAFWAEFLEKKTVGEIDPYSAPLREVILSLIKEKDRVLEIGPGWGNYTFSLLNKVSELTVVDSSESVLQFISNMAGDKSLQTAHVKWENFKSNDSFDVVIGINCFYRMFEIKKTILNMDRHSSRLCIAGMTTGPLAPHYYVLENQYGYKIKHPRRDYIHFLHLLYECGIYADCKLVPLMRTASYDSLKDAAQEESSKLLSQEVDPDHVIQSLKPYLKKTGQKYVYEQPFYGALITWKPGMSSQMDSMT
ncbi:class I SAM-dependent methyltransferase [Salipaludibacillus sp. CUR1]|uniref:class I SAM-dependent methyltransferase n=1 Tax=Salipaludibacillus sp. CUR1 TaxID=2820003 RepID=UPI001E65AF3A|nr:class I SAM-dependent methyltransferase [Salipaludibacillus sp. CUR1]MCE7792191.1 class I SAM-dependent methyltransferase [Salipaludibacillus sp. CUR1]